jgi:hypothetical protein
MKLRLGMIGGGQGAFIGVVRLIAARIDGDDPGIDDGVRGMAFIENVIASGKSDIKWTKFNV